MSARLLSLVVVVTALTGYHLAQRSMPGAVRPAPLFAFVYGAAALVMIVAVTLDGSGGMRAVSGAAMHWAPWLLVLSVALSLLWGLLRTPPNLFSTGPAL